MSGPATLKVFLSYTAEDLSRHADVVAGAVLGLNMMPVDHRSWAATGTPSVQECKRRIEDCQIVVVLVAHRLGWVPRPDEGGDGIQSITQIEVEHAKSKGLRVLPFVVHKEAEWRADQIEGYGNPVIKERLDGFKCKLQETLAGFFTTPISLDGPVSRALRQAADELFRGAADGAATSTTSEPEDELILPWTATSGQALLLPERLGSQRPKRILTIDDAWRSLGACLGFLQRIQELLRIRYAKEDFFLSDYYDLIVGVGWSTFLAAFLAQRIDVLALQELCSMFVSAAVRPSFLLKRFRHLYSDRQLARFLTDVFGTRTLGGDQNQTGLLLVATDMESSEPFAFTNHPDWSGYSTWSNLSLADLVLACSMSPIFFPPKRLVAPDKGKEGIFVDAAISIGNNPALYGLLTATSNRFPFQWRLGRNWLALTSVGGKQSSTRRTLKEAEQPNILNLVAWLPSSLMAGASIQDNMMLEALGFENNSSAAPAGYGAALTYRRYELLQNALGSPVPPAENPFDAVTDLSDLRSELPAQIARARGVAQRIITMTDFKRSFDVRRPVELSTDAGSPQAR